MRYWLQNTRIDRGMTTKDISTALELSEEYYLKIEHGLCQKKMDMTLVAKLSVVLKLPMADILEWERMKNTEERQ